MKNLKKLYLLFLILTIFTTDILADDNNNLYRIFTNGLYGYIDKAGEVVINPKYSTAYEFSEGMAAYQKDYRWGYISSDGREIEAKYYEAQPFSEGVAAVRKARESGSMTGWAYIDKNGEEVISGIRMRSCSTFSEGLASVSLQVPGQTWLLHGYIDKNGNVIISPQYRYGCTFNSDGTAFVNCERLMNPEYDEKSFLINRRGQRIAGPFDSACLFSENLASISHNDLFGFVNTAGELVIPFKYQKAFNYHNGLAYAENGNVRGFIDKNDKIVIDFITKNWEFKCSFVDGITSVKEGNLYHIINLKGEILCTTNTYLKPMPGNILRERTSNKYRIIDTDYNTIISHMFDELKIIKNGLAAFKLWDKWGFLDYNQKICILPQFEDVGDFKEDLCLFKENDLWGYINKNGKVIIPAIYSKAYDFSGGFASVNLDNEWLTINTNGDEAKTTQSKIDFSSWSNKIVNEPKGNYEYKSEFSSEGYALVKDKYTFNYLDLNLNYIYYPYGIDKKMISEKNLPHFGIIKKSISSDFKLDSEIIVLQKKFNDNTAICLVENRAGQQLWISENNISYCY